IDATGDATSTAVYAATTIDINDQWRVDFGVRNESHDIEYAVDTGVDGDIDFVAIYDETEVSWTGALNYLFNDSMSGFVRINQGSKMPYFDDFRDNQGAYASGNNLIQEVDQFELGFHWVTDTLALYATGFFTEVDPTFFVALAGQGAVIQTQESSGIEIDAIWDTGSPFTVSLNATIQDTEIKNGPSAGNESPRQPGWQLRLTPTYDFQIGGMVDGTLYGTLIAVDDRWGEPENVNQLDGYEQIDLGVVFRVNDRFTVQVAADNITDEDALTESDPRTIAAPNGRYIMPRTLTFSIGYEF
ncbi:MAG TPA: TonB-dependent receptor, partial [Gammaproteobacteria bacterium]|nr:TonB-dependent receptor [Gammaproteobacteria bacterium]